MATTEPIRDKRQVRQLAEYYLTKGQIRNYVLIILGVYTALRISDLLRLRWNDVYDFENNRVRRSVTIIEKKTRKSKTFTLNKDAIKALTLYAKYSARPLQKAAFLIENPRSKQPISRIQAYRIIRTASEKLKFQKRASCHSLRKTFGYHAWKSGVSPAILLEIYNHSSLSVTRRYLGVSQEDKDKVYLNMQILS